MGEGRDFECVICQRMVCMRWSRIGSDGPIAPICFCCEGEYGGRSRAHSAGSFRDRREVVRGLALAEAIRGEASRQKWEANYAAS